MEIKFEGRISFVDCQVGFHIVGFSGEPGTEGYSSFSFESSFADRLNCMFGSKYTLVVSDKGDKDYQVSCIDGIGAGEGYVAVILNSIASENVTNTVTKQFKLIVPIDAKLLKELKSNDKVSITLDVKEKREDSK